MPLPFAGNPIGWPFIELQSIDSTNKYAMGLVHGTHLPYLPTGQAGGQYEVQHGMAVFAHEQTAGKGQRGKNWTSETGQNIALSIVLNPYPLSIPEQFRLSVFAAVSVCEFFSKYGGDETKIKWPNDLYWRDRKAGGILIENVIHSSESGVGSRELQTHHSSPDSYRDITHNWKWAIIGVGININQTSFPDDLPNPVSLKQITGKSFQPVELAKELCSVLEKNYPLLFDKKIETLFKEYQRHLYKKDEKVKIKNGTRVFEAMIKGVSENGQLITQHSIEERFEFGEVEWLIN